MKIADTFEMLVSNKHSLANIIVNMLNNTIRNKHFYIHTAASGSLYVCYWSPFYFGDNPKDYRRETVARISDHIDGGERNILVKKYMNKRLYQKAKQIAFGLIQDFRNN